MMDRQAARRAVRATRTRARGVRSSPYIQAELVLHDPATQLSIVEIEGEEVANVPKLREVSLGGVWEPVAEGWETSPAEDFSVPVASGYTAFRMEIGGAATDEGLAYLRLNGDSSTVYDYGALVYDSAGALDLSEHNATSSAFRLHQFSTVTGQGTASLTQSVSIAGNKFWHVLAYGSRISTGAGACRVCEVWGRYGTTDVDVTSLDFGMAGAPTFESFNFFIEGRRPFPEPPGTQLLCVSTDNHPLTIVGVKTGSTI